MSIKSSKIVTNNRTWISSLQGISLAFICSAASELLLGSLISMKDPLSVLGRVTMVASLLYLIHRFARTSLKQYRPSLKDIITLALVLIGMLVIIALGRVLAVSLVSHFRELEIERLSRVASSVSIESLHFAIPFAAGGILLQLIWGLQYGLIFGLVLGLITGLYFPNEPMLVPYVIGTTLVGCLSMVRFRSRSAYLRAGLNVACVGILFAICISFVDGSLSLPDLLACTAGAILGGVFCSFLIAGITPVLEYLGSYVTDMTLLEMATLDHPLLKELSISAPGTWNHSMVMGMMSEAAADSIRANPVLARVSCYYHDIGKMKNPLYFVENQVRGENRHDKLSSSMSALIIRSHVKDGIKMAKQHRLPEIIIDMIPQHHGTSLIEFFYNKACKEAEEAGESQEVDKELYTYPGPKPQTKEAGIIMLADGVEAAARTLADPSLDKIQGMVQKMINKVFASGELNECELTLRDLHSIAKCFTRVLNGIYHQRISYPDSVEKGTEKAKENSADEAVAENKQVSNGKKVANGSSAEKSKDGKAKDGKSKDSVASGASGSKRERQSQSKQDKEPDKEDLKRLGL